MATMNLPEIEIAFGQRRFFARLLSPPYRSRFQAEEVHVFQSRAFFKAAIENVGTPRGVAPLLVGVSDCSGREAAIFPFTLRNVCGLRVVEGLDLDITDYFAPPWLNGPPPTVTETDQMWTAVCAALPPADVVTFKKTPLAIAGRRHALSAFRGLRPMGTSATTLLLDGSVDYRRLGVARDVRKKLRKLGTIGEIRFEQAAGHRDITEAMDALVAFRTARFARLGRPNTLGGEGIHAFYRALAIDPSLGQPGRLFALRVGSEIVAVVYAFCHDGVFTATIPAISDDPRWLPVSPGICALYLALEWAVEQRYRVFDLSVGAMHFKSRFEAKPVPLYEYQQALRPAGILALGDASMRRWTRNLGLRYAKSRLRLPTC